VGGSGERYAETSAFADWYLQNHYTNSAQVSNMVKCREESMSSSTASRCYAAGPAGHATYINRGLAVDGCHLPFLPRSDIHRAPETGRFGALDNNPVIQYPLLQRFIPDTPPPLADLSSMWHNSCFQPRLKPSLLVTPVSCCQQGASTRTQ
jgi:hypothetical protein